jgi:hypothetical protein
MDEYAHQFAVNDAATACGAVATGFSLTTRQSLIGAAQMPQSSFFLTLLLISGLR